MCVNVTLATICDLLMAVFICHGAPGFRSAVNALFSIHGLYISNINGFVVMCFVIFIFPVVFYCFEKYLKSGLKTLQRRMSLRKSERRAVSFLLGKKC